MAYGREVVFGGEKVSSQIRVDFVGNLAEQIVNGTVKFLFTKLVSFHMFGLFLLVARQKIRLAVNLWVGSFLVRNGLINQFLSQFLQRLPLSFGQWFLGPFCLSWFSKRVMAALMGLFGFLVVGQWCNIGNFRVNEVVMSSCFGMLCFGLMRLMSLRSVHVRVLFSLRVLQSRIVVSLRVNMALLAANCGHNGTRGVKVLNKRVGLFVLKVIIVRV